MRFGYLLLGSLLAASAVVVACTAAVPKAAPLTLRDAGNNDNGNTNPSRTDPLPASDPVQADGGKPVGKVYVHTADTLFVFDPLAAKGAGSITEIALFDCLVPGDQMIDIALDRSNNMYGTSFAGFLKISPTDAKCSYIAKASNLPNSLAFMPVGTVDATQEALVGFGFDAANSANQFLRIDVNTGKTSLIGNLNPPDRSGQGTQYEASGDIIGLSRGGNRAFVTVKQVPPDGGVASILSDSLAEIDPKTGAIKTVHGETGFNGLFGLGQWAGQAYAFSGDPDGVDTGKVVKIDLETGVATAVAIDAGSPVAWFGAGVTTLAPTKP